MKTILEQYAEKMVKESVIIDYFASKNIVGKSTIDDIILAHQNGDAINIALAGDWLIEPQNGDYIDSQTLISDAHMIDVSFPLTVDAIELIDTDKKYRIVAFDKNQITYHIFIGDNSSVINIKNETMKQKKSILEKYAKPLAINEEEKKETLTLDDIHHIALDLSKKIHDFLVKIKKTNTPLPLKSLNAAYKTFTTLAAYEPMAPSLNEEGTNLKISSDSINGMPSSEKQGVADFAKELERDVEITNEALDKKHEWAVTLKYRTLSDYATEPEFLDAEREKINGYNLKHGDGEFGFFRILDTDYRGEEQIIEKDSMKYENVYNPKELLLEMELKKRGLKLVEKMDTRAALRKIMKEQEESGLDLVLFHKDDKGIVEKILDRAGLHYEWNNEYNTFYFPEQEETIDALEEQINALKIPVSYRFEKH